MTNATEIQFDIVGVTEDGTNKIKFTNTQFDSIIFTMGKVSFEEVGDEAIMHYEYDIVEHDTELEPEQRKEFDNLVGEYLIQSIERGIKNQDLIYAGGTDAD
jgi:hypothetical protein